MSFDNKTVWITGASSGIGEALAYAFAEAGARLILSARSEDKLHAVRATCAHTERHRVVPLDLADAEAIEAAAGQV
ncbi:MAG: SDR family NAD(P)-dependent oxidoreductase, partial [Acidiferrobacterales bacterium]|nr:SDR family NAD(P)-dependent oxidoreductase [Acidiferrobacterales bacterium]